LARTDFELYDLTGDLQELDNVADRHPEIMTKVQQAIRLCYTPERPGEVLDESIGFKDHQAK
jgi:hypothetical protein